MRLSSMLVALDSSSRSGSVLRAAADLANKAKAELRAMYVEEAEWFEASKHSFTRQISSYTGSLVPLSEQHITRESKALGATLEKLFIGISEQLSIKYSYQSVRGEVGRELIDAVNGSDMIIIGRTGRFGQFSRGPGSTARYLAEKSPKPVLIWSSEIGWPGQFIGLCGLPAESIPVIKWTMELGQALERSVRLFFPGDAGLNVDWEASLEDLNGELEYPIDKIRKISEVLPDLNLSTLQYYQKELLIVQRSNLNVTPSEFLEKVPNSVILI